MTRRKLYDKAMDVGLHVRISKELETKLLRTCVRNKKGVSEIMRLALEEYLDKAEPVAATD